VDSLTARVYEDHARQWIARRTPRALESGQLDAFAARVRRGGRIADLGCGPGWYAAHLRAAGFAVTAFDLSRAMLSDAARRDPALPRVRGDLAALPFADASLDAAWASACYQHLPRHELPLALARLHAALRVGAPVALVLADLERLDDAICESADGERELRFEDDVFGPRLFSLYTPERLRALLEGAGFEAIELVPSRRGFWIEVRARRARTLPDLIASDLRLLVCGLNPSLYAADRGIPFARPGNRFWGAARGAGLVERDREVLAALGHGIGFTDLVKRATVRAAELAAEEYAAGVQRVEALVRRHRPRVTCFVGLDGWRRAVDRRARPGWIANGFAGRPAYLMPSTSGRNAHASLERLTEHLRTAAAGPP
jgi:TDG/mug DNA glycosylase family protein